MLLCSEFTGRSWLVKWRQDTLISSARVSDLTSNSPVSQGQQQQQQQQQPQLQQIQMQQLQHMSQMQLQHLQQMQACGYACGS